MTTFTLADLASKSDAAYIAIDGKVYSIAKYMDTHPGGEEILQEVLGQDATEAFHEVGHSQTAVEQLKPLYVGDLQASSKPHQNKQSASAIWSLSPLLSWMLAVIAGGVLAILAAITLRS